MYLTTYCENERGEIFSAAKAFEFLQVNDDEEQVDRLLAAASDSYETRQPVSQDILPGGGGWIFS